MRNKLLVSVAATALIASTAMVAAQTGGRTNPTARQVFDAGGRTLSTTWQLWPVLLSIAIALTITELVARKWAGLKLAFRRS